MARHAWLAFCRPDHNRDWCPYRGVPPGLPAWASGCPRRPPQSRRQSHLRSAQSSQGCLWQPAQPRARCPCRHTPAPLQKCRQRHTCNLAEESPLLIPLETAAHSRWRGWPGRGQAQPRPRARPAALQARGRNEGQGLGGWRPSAAHSQPNPQVQHSRCRGPDAFQKTMQSVGRPGAN